MTGILGLALPPWLNPTILGAAAIGIAGMASGGYIVHRWDAGTIANARLETAKVNSDYTAYKALVVENAARATASAEAERKRLQAHSDDLQRQLLETQKVADEKSDKLRKILSTASPGDVRPIGPAVGRYLDGLRN